MFALAIDTGEEINHYKVIERQKNFVTSEINIYKNYKILNVILNE
jgi:hypothetical protein